MTTTILESEADTIVAASDLDLLDDDKAHCACVVCNPGPPRFGMPYVAICGRRAVYRDNERAYTPPPNACEDCLDRYRLPCSECGW